LKDGGEDHGRELRKKEKGKRNKEKETRKKKQGKR
jgi:hypothetical protein